MGKAAPSAKVFHYPWWGTALSALAAILFGAGAWYSLYSGASFWQIAIYCGMAPLAALGFVSVLFTRVELGPDELVVRSGLTRRAFKKCDLADVSWAKGVPVSVKTQSGEWISLPSVSVGSQSLANSIRPWIRGGGERAV